MGKLIAYECEAQGHDPSPNHPDKLTVYDGRWAFCPFSARADGHVWRETGGEDIAALMRKAGLQLIAAGNEVTAGTRAAAK